MIGKYVADMMVKPGKSPVFGNPADFGLEYEDVTFEASDGVTLSGWLVKGGTDGVIVQTHFGLQCSRSGYSPKAQGLVKLWDRDIAFLNQAKYLVEAGYSVLMYDMRNHGQSGAGTCPWITWGLEERQDVIAAVDFVAKHPDYQDASVGLLSICIGQNASTLAFDVENGLQTYANLKAMVSVQPVTYAAFIKAMGVPDFLVRRANQVIHKRTGIDFSTNTFVPSVKRISAPTLVIQNRNDPWTDVDLVQQVYDELTVEKELLWLDLEKKRAAAYDWIGHNPDEILSWFEQHMDLRTGS